MGGGGSLGVVWWVLSSSPPHSPLPAQKRYLAWWTVCMCGVGCVRDPAVKHEWRVRLKALELKTQVSCFKWMGSSEGQSGGRGFRSPPTTVYTNGQNAICGWRSGFFFWRDLNIGHTVTLPFAFLLVLLYIGPWFIQSSHVFSSHPMNGGGCPSFVSYYWFISCCYYYFCCRLLLFYTPCCGCNNFGECKKKKRKKKKRLDCWSPLQFETLDAEALIPKGLHVAFTLWDSTPNLSVFLPFLAFRLVR